MRLDWEAYVRNYKCFGDEWVGFSEFKPINVLVGKNNAGKSSLIEFIQWLCKPGEPLLQRGRRGAASPEFRIVTWLTEDDLRPVFDERSSGGPIQENHWDYGRQWIDRQITLQFELGQARTLVDINPPMHEHFQKKLAAARHIHKKALPIQGCYFLHLGSDRDILPEKERSNLIGADGSGITTAYWATQLRDVFDETIIDRGILSALNRIFAPSSFAAIKVQQVGEEWEIFVEEDAKGRIALSESGSGFKTVLGCLACLHLDPHLQNRSPENYVYAFEELENNLHPEVQRRLFQYLREVAVERRVPVFISTHSSVVIDQFSADEEAQIIHIAHDGVLATATPVVTYSSHQGILDDLDYRASDLLQSNVVIWVEGPSDRTYLNRWIRLVTDGELREGLHYQCVFYGGSLLAAR